MTDEERIERLENKLKEALFWWRATEKQLSQKCKETKANQKTIERLKAENAELRARLEKAVELPRIIHPNANEWFVQYQNEYGLIFDEIFYSERAAEARLKELKEENDD